MRRKPLSDFTGADAAQAWQTVTDGVTGGRSEGRFMSTDNQATGFLGTLSLDNYGGFASVRARAMQQCLGGSPASSLAVGVEP